MSTIIYVERDDAGRLALEDALERTGHAVTVVEVSNAVVLTTLNVDEAERALIARALQVTDGNRTRAALLLGISVRTLRNKLSARTAAA
jgi:DNA-binding protein Fis